MAAGISVYELRLKQVLAMMKQQIRSTLGRELNVAAMLVQDALDAELSKVSHLTSRQLIFMMVLRCDEEMSTEGVCRQFGLLPSEVDEFLAPLVTSGFVLRGDSMALSAEGERVLAKLWFTVESTEEMILSQLTPAEVSALMHHLRQIQSKCVEMMRDGAFLDSGRER